MRCTRIKKEVNDKPILQLTVTTGKNEKSIFLTCPCHEIYKEEAVGLKSNYYFCEYVKLGAISWKFDVLSITA